MKDTFIIIKSCWAFKKRRDATRETWLTQLDRAWADYAFVMGAHAPVPRLYGNQLSNLFGETDIQAYLEDDGHRCIGPKLQHAIADTVEKYKNIVVLDDDTYVIPARLKCVVETVQYGDYVGFLRNGAGSWGAMRYMQGSAYILSYPAAKICSVAQSMKEVKPDDVAVGEALEPYDINFRHDERFDPGPYPCKPPLLATTNLITTHKVSPERMKDFHAGVLNAARQD